MFGIPLSPKLRRSLSLVLGDLACACSKRKLKTCLVISKVIHLNTAERVARTLYVHLVTTMARNPCRSCFDGSVSVKHVSGRSSSRCIRETRIENRVRTIRPRVDPETLPEIVFHAHVLAAKTHVSIIHQDMLQRISTSNVRDENYCVSLYPLLFPE